MDLSKLEKYKRKYKAFDSKIASLQGFLNDIDKSNVVQKVLQPYVLSRRLSIPELDIIFVLNLAEKEQLVHKAYKIWTIDDQYYLGEFSTPDAIPQKIRNNETGEYVDRENFYASLVFEVSNE